MRENHKERQGKRVNETDNKQRERKRGGERKRERGT